MPAGETIKKSLDLLRGELRFYYGEEACLGQLAWMLFLKLLDDMDAARRPGELRILPEDLGWRRWAAPGSMNGEELVAFVEGTLFPRLASLSGPYSLHGMVRDVFADAVNVVKRGDLLRQVVDEISAIDFGAAETLRDAGSVYADLPGRPSEPSRALLKFLVERVDPGPGEAVLGLPAGAGSLLVTVFDHLAKKLPHVAGPWPRTRVVDPSWPRIEGIEGRWLHHLLCAADPRLWLHLSELDAQLRIWRSEDLVWLARKQEPVDAVVAAGPFAPTSPFQVVDPELRKSLPPGLRFAEWEALSIYHIAKLLRDRGRAAIGVSSRFLGARDIFHEFERDGGERWVREMLLAECNLHTVVRVPAGGGNDQGQNLLFFTKGEPAQEVWYYEHTSGEDWEPLRKWWTDRRETLHAWRVSLREIKARDFDLDRRPIARNDVPVPSRVLSLSLRGFRGFERLELDLPPEGPAVFIGVNGAGKSTVLDGIGALLSAYAQAMTSYEVSSGTILVGTDDIRIGDPGATLDVTVRLGDEESAWELAVDRSKPKSEQSADIGYQAGRLAPYLLRFEDANLPILCSYSASRRLGGDERQRARPSPLPQLEAYDRAFNGGLGPFRDFIGWFRLEEGIENQVRLRQDPAHRNPRLEVVRKALQRFLEALGAGPFSDVHIERTGEEKEGTLVVQKNGVPLRIEQLSEGEKNTLLLVADVARRLAIANPGRPDPLQGEGIVLIDEIDLHLHPAWQRGVLPALAATFPRCQIIATTHSPQVLSQIPRENVFILEDFKLVKVTPHTYGRDTNSILAEVMGVPERPGEMEEKLHAAAVLIDQGRHEEAKKALDDLLSVLGENDADLFRMRSMMSFLERPVRD